MPCIKCGAALPEGALFCPMCGKKQSVEKRKDTKARGNGTGSVYRRGSTWVAAVTVGCYTSEAGKLCIQRRKKGGFRTKKEALAYLPQLRSALEKKRDISFKALYDLWVPTHKCSKSTMGCYSAALRYFCPLWPRPLRTIDVDDLQSCIDDCPKGRRTQENMRAVVGLMYKYGEVRDYVPRNLGPYLSVGGEHGQHRAGFTAGQLEQIRRAVGVVPYADYILCMCYLGFRPSEFLALDVRDYDRAQHFLRGGAKTEAGKDRVVTISPKIQPCIDALTRDRIAGALFCDSSGGYFRYDTFRDACFYPALEQIGIENPVEDGRHRLSPHSCRHTFATLAKTIQAPDKDKMELIGHASPEMLRYYQDVSLSDLRKITDAL